MIQYRQNKLMIRFPNYETMFSIKYKVLYFLYNDF